MRGTTDNLDRQSLRGFLHMVETEYPDELLRIQQPIDPRFEMTALVFELDRAGKNPVVVFENVAGYDMPVVTNVAANRKLLAACLGVESAQPADRVPRAMPEIHSVRDGGAGGLERRRHRRRRRRPHQAADPAAILGRRRALYHRRPDLGARSGERRRHHRLSSPDAQGQEPPRRLAAFAPAHVRIPPPRGRARQSLPAVITIGTHPLHYMGSMVYAYPPNVRKFEIIGGLFGEPYRLARCGVDDLEVPAGAEIIIEGEILAGVHEPEGPFGEFTGYASYRSTQNVFVAHRIRMRGDAMFHSVTSGMSKDHILVSCITREGEILNALRRNLPNVRAVHVPHTTCGAFMAFISMKKTADGEPQMAIMATLGTELYTKYVIVVDDDVDIFDLNDVMWAVATRVRAEKDIFFIPGAKAAILDPTSDPQNFTVTKMGIDATRPAGRDFAERLVISDEQRAAGAQNPRQGGINF